MAKIFEAQFCFMQVRKYDVDLYKRGKDYVLHRIIEVEKDHYLIRGDNTFAMETVPFSSVMGMLASFQRKGKCYDVNNKGQIYSYLIR